jgi:hypothetical protein
LGTILTDGEEAFFCLKEADKIEEEPLKAIEKSQTASPEKKGALSIPKFVYISKSDVDKLSVVQPKHELVIHAVPFSNTLKRHELKECLLLALENKVKVSIFGDQSK